MGHATKSKGLTMANQYKGNRIGKEFLGQAVSYLLWHLDSVSQDSGPLVAQSMAASAVTFEETTTLVGIPGL